MMPNEAGERSSAGGMLLDLRFFKAEGPKNAFIMIVLVVSGTGDTSWFKFQENRGLHWLLGTRSQEVAGGCRSRCDRHSTYW